jgi:hypothetical protein
VQLPGCPSGKSFLALGIPAATLKLCLALSLALLNLKSRLLIPSQ